MGSARCGPPPVPGEAGRPNGYRSRRSRRSRKPRRAWTALDPDKTRIIARRYGKDNMSELIRLLTNFRTKLLTEGWDGKVE